MGSESPNVILYDVNGQEMSVSNAAAIPTGTSALMVAGSDGTNSRFFTLDTSGRQITVGAGTAGTPVGGVVTIQGITSGTPIPTSNTPADGTSSGALGALNATVQITTAGYNSVGMQLAAGTLIGTLVAETSFDGGTTWNATVFNDVTTSNNTATVVFASSNTATAKTLIGVGGSGLTRVRVSAYTSGTATATLRASVVRDPSTLNSGAPGSATPSVIGQIGGSVTTAAPVYTTGTLNALSLDTNGNLRITGTVTAANASVSTTATAPPGSATYMGASVTTAAPTYSTGQMNPPSLTTGGLLRIDGVYPTGAAPGADSVLIAGSVTTSSPTYTTGQMNNLSLTTAGALRIDGSAVTQPVSGTVTANAGTGTFNVAGTVTANAGTGNFAVVQATASNLNATVVASGNFNNASVSGTAAAPPASATYVGGLVATSAPTYTSGQMDALSMTINGLLRIDGVYPTGAAAGSDAILIAGSVTTGSPTYTTGQMNSLSLTTAGALRVDGSAVTQPVSGTMTANQGTANTLANAWPTEITDGTHGPAAVKAASTAAVATDQALVVAISPNNSFTVSSGDASTTGTLGAANATVAVTHPGLETIGFQIETGTLIGTIVPEVSTDGGTTWNGVVFVFANGSTNSSYTFGASNTALTGYIVGIGGTGMTRIRVSAYTSGTATATIRASDITSNYIRTKIDNDITIIHNNATVTTSGTTYINGVGRKEISMGVYVNGTVTGSPSLTYTVQEVDPITNSNDMTLPGNSVTNGPFVAQGHNNYVEMISYTGSIRVTWAFTGTGTFNGIDAWVVVKEATLLQGLTFTGSQNPLSVVNIDANDNTIVVGPAAAGAVPGGNPVLVAGSDGTDVRTILTDTLSRQIVAGAGVAGTPAGGVLSVQGVAGGTAIPFTATSADGTATGTLGALNATVQITMAGYSGAGMQLAAGTLIGTLVAETSFDAGTTWNATVFNNATTSNNTSTIVFAASNTATAATLIGAGGAGLIRVRVSAYTSGTAGVTLRSSQVKDPSTLNGGPTGGTLPAVVAQMGGSVTTAAPTYTTATLNALSLTTAGALRIDGSAVTQPVSIASAVTVAQATAASLNATVVQSTAANLKMTDAATSATAAAVPALASMAGGSVTTAAPAYTTGNLGALSLDTTGNLRVLANQPTAANLNATVVQATAANLNATVNMSQVGGTNVVTGGVAGSQGVGGLAAAGAVPAGNPVLVGGSDGTDVRTLLTDSTGRLSTKAICSTGTNTTVASATASTTLLAINANRIGATIFNASTAILYVKFSATASSTSYTLQIAASGYFEVPYGYTGVINGAWATVNGNAQITELT